MGTLIGHILPGVWFCALGIWHAFSIIRLYATSPSRFRGQPWYPTQGKGVLRYVELLGIALGACISIAAELFIFPRNHYPLEDDWSIASKHLNNFEHSSMSMFFLIYAVVALLSEATAVLPLPPGILYIFGGVALGQELMLFHLHSSDHHGLEGHYHLLLQLPIAIGLAATILESAFPKNVNLSLLSALMLLLQGTWFLQMAASIWIPCFVPKGCSMTSGIDHRTVVCDTPENQARAKALANLQLSWHLATILVVVATSFAVLPALLRLRALSSKYESLQQNSGDFLDNHGCGKTLKSSHEHLQENSFGLPLQVIASADGVDQQLVSLSALEDGPAKDEHMTSPNGGSSASSSPSGTSMWHGNRPFASWNRNSDSHGPEELRVGR